MKKLNTFILMLILLIPFTLTNTLASEETENKLSHYYTIADGLPSNQINGITTTDNGLVWIGGYSGLTKYDGNNFYSYSMQNDLSIKNIMSLASDKNDLYIGTQSGLIKYNMKSFSKIDLNGKYKVSEIAITDKLILLGTNNGLLSVNKETYEVTTISTDPIASVTVYENDKIYYVNESKELYISYNQENTLILKDEFSSKSAKVIGDELYLGGYDGKVYVKHLKADGYLTYSTGIKDEINTFYQFQDTVYVGSKKGLYTLKNNTLSYDSKMELSAIKNIVADYQGNIWVASSNAGVAKIYSTLFTNIFDEYSLDSNSLVTSSSVNAFAIYKNKYYIGSNTQLLEFDPKTNSLNVLIEARIRDLKIYNNMLYIATYNSDLYDLAYYDGNNLNNITGFYLSGDEDESNAKMIRCLSVYNDNIVVGTNYGVSLVKNNNVIKTIKLTNEPLSINTYDNKIYVCVDVVSVNIYDINLNLLDEIQVIESSPLKSIVVDNCLIYSENASLISVNLSTKETKEIKLTTNANGSITDIFKANGNIYLSTSSCELFIIKENELFNENPNIITLGISNGFTSGSTANGSGYYDSINNDYYFSTSNGVLHLDLDNINSSSVPLKLVINQIQVDNKIYYVDDEIAIDKNTSRITIDFSIVSFLEGKKKTIHYKLDGIDQDYKISDGNITDVSYTNLSGGSYQFHIYVIDETGNTMSETINFTIVKDFQVYEQAWFWIVLAISTIAIIGALVFLFVKIKINKANAKVKLQREITRESIVAIATSIDAKDRYTNGHSIRVGEYSKIIAENMGYTGVDLENIYYTALLHDVGKIGVPDSVLNKPSRLDDNEFKIIKNHTLVGADILKNITTIPHIIEGAKHHHERYDGTGYPDGLKGEEIPLISRIICAADCYDAMASKRVYKPSFDKEKIVSEFERCSGTQFDPNIAKLMVRLINEGIIYPIDLENNNVE